MSPSQSTDGGDDDYTPSHFTRSRAGQFDPAAFASLSSGRPPAPTGGAPRGCDRCRDRKGASTLLLSIDEAATLSIAIWLSRFRARKRSDGLGHTLTNAHQLLTTLNARSPLQPSHADVCAV